MIGLVSVTKAGHAGAERLAQAWPDARRYAGPAAAALPRAFTECDAIVCFLAVGATIRLVAPLLASKHEDPGVVCVDEALRFAVPVLGAHQGGGNDLARRVAETLGAEPVVTTASDAAGSWASPSSRAATWPPSGPRSCPASASPSVLARNGLARSGRSRRCRRTSYARTGPNPGFPPSW